MNPFLPPEKNENKLVNKNCRPLGTHTNNNNTDVILNDADDIQFKQK